MTGCTFLRLGEIMEIKAKQSENKFKCYKSEDGTRGIVEAVGVLFDVQDLDGETFTAKTYYGKAQGDGVDATLNHRMPITTESKKANGVLKSFAKNTFENPVKSELSDLGLIGRHVLNLANKFEEWVFEQAEQGAFKWSTGSAPHMVDVDKDGTIKTWPIIEWAYTPTPAQPKNGIISSVKTFVVDENPEAEQENRDDDHNAQTIVIHNHIDTNGAKTMSDQDTETQEAEAKYVTADEFNERIDKVLKAVETVTEVATLKPKKKNVDAHVTEDEADRKAKGNPFKSAGEFYKAVQDAAANGQYDQRLKPLKSEMAKEGVVYQLPEAAQEAIKAPTGLSEVVPADGGFLVGSDRRDGVMMRDYMTGQVWGRAQNIPIGANSNGLTINAIDETSRASGSRWGGVLGYWLAEAAEKTASRPKFRQIEPKLKKVAALVYATDELLQDSTALAGVINTVVPQELGFQKDDAAINGSGVGKPLGILNSGALVTVAKESGQAAATLVAENVVNMWARRWGTRPYVWFVNRDTTPQLVQMELGSGGDLVYMPPGGLSGSPFGTIFGAPVIEIEQCQTLGTVGDIILADMSQYLTISKGGVQAQSSIHVRFIYDESVFRFVERVDGMPTWDAPLTPANGSNTQSPFVALATRA